MQTALFSKSYDSSNCGNAIFQASRKQLNIVVGNNVVIHEIGRKIEKYDKIQSGPFRIVKPVAICRPKRKY